MTQFITWMPPHVAFYLHLDHWRTINNLIRRFKDKPIVYGLLCVETGMIYIGSSFVGHDRLHQHLVTGNSSNPALQAAIAQHGLAKFKAYIFVEVKFPPAMSYADRKAYLTSIEQEYMNKFPAAQLYNQKSANLSSTT
jgi:hypothetical protein